MALTYGKLTYSVEHNLFGIYSMPAHVIILLKRVFPRISAKRASEFVITATDAVCMDLKWFMQRYPLKASDGALGRLNEGEASFLQKRADIELIKQPEWKASDNFGFRDGFAPYPYQSQAAAIAVRTGRLLLMDDVGLGKTVSSLAALSGGAPLPAAIVVQPHLAEQWQEEFINVFTKLSSHIIEGRKIYNLPPRDLYIFKYSNISAWESIFAQGMFRSVVFDEIQELRHGTSTAKGQAAIHLVGGAEMVMGLTATPIYNYGNEIFNVVRLLDEDVLGSSFEFNVEWCGWGKTVSDPKALGHFLRDNGIALRRTEEDIDDQRPPLNRILHEVPWDDDLASDSIDLATSLAGQVLGGSFTERGQAARELDILLRQVTGVAKARYVAAYVDLLLNDVDKVLVAGWHRDVYDIWNDALSHRKCVMYTGSESPKKKTKSKEAFINGDAQVMFISLRSGAGLDGLQNVCSDVVIGELDWSPQVHTQVIGRVRRPGQKGTVTAHFLHTDNGSDPLIIEMNGLKAAQAQGVVDPDKDITLVQSDESRIKRLAQAYLSSLQPSLI